MTSSFIKTFFIAFLVGALAFMAIFQFSTTYLDEYDVEVTDTYASQLNDKFEQISLNSNESANTWMNELNNGTTSGVDITLGFFRTSYNVLKGMLGYMADAFGISYILGEALGLPDYVVTIAMAIIIIIFIIALILILIGSGII